MYTSSITKDEQLQVLEQEVCPVSQRVVSVTLGNLTLKEGDQQLGRLRGVLGHGRATDGANGSVSTAQADGNISRAGIKPPDCELRF